LAVFLGVGAAVTMPDWVASAEPPATSATTSDSAPATDAAPSGTADPAGTADPTGTAMLTGTATHTATTHKHRTAAAAPKMQVSADTPTTTSAQPAKKTKKAPTDPGPAEVTPASATAPTRLTVASPSKSAAPTVTPSPPPSLFGGAVTAAKQLIEAALGPLVSTLPSHVPPQSPMVWTVLAWVRREVEQNLFPHHVVPTWSVTSPNLLVNPSAEVGDPSLSGTSSVTIPGWSVTGTPTVIEYGAKRRTAWPLPTPGPVWGSYPGVGPSPTDKQFFGGGNVGTSTLSQTVDLNAAASTIDAGSVPFKLSGRLGGAASDPSAASITVQFLAGDGTSLGFGKIGPVTALDRWLQTGLLERDTSGVIPVGTRSVQVVVTLKESNPAALGYNNAYADDVSLTVGAALPAPPPPAPPASTVGALDHVFMVYMENKGYADVVGSPNAPYINSLINTYGVATAYYALTHPSDPNYYPILGGSDFGFNYNCPTDCFDQHNLADTIEAAKKTWAGYAQGMSPAGPYVETADYAPEELPFLAYRDIYNDPTRAAAHLFPLTQLATDLTSATTTPNFVWFAANETNNMEGPVNSVGGVLSYVVSLLTNRQYNIKAGDTFVQGTVSTIMNSAVWQDTTQKSAIFLTFDEDSNNLSLGFANEGNHVVTIVIPSPGAVAAGMRAGSFTVDGYANHYSLLRTIENALGLPTLTANDAYAEPLNGFWKPPVMV
jgi:hypothetical protein